MADEPYPYDEVDGCDLDFAVDPTPNDEVDLVTLFAEGLDPNNPKTIEEVRAEWEELFGAAP